MVLEMRQPVHGGWSMKVCVCTSVFVFEHTWCIMLCLCLCWSAGTLVFEEDAPGSAPVSRACVVFPHLFFSLAALKLVIAMSSLRRCFKNKWKINPSLLSLCWALHHNTRGGVEMWKTRLSGECSAGATAPFYLLSTSCWVMVCPIQLPPTTHTSSNVSPYLHGHKNCCTNLHFSIPCHCSWYIDIKCIVECHEKSPYRRPFVRHSTLLWVLFHIVTNTYSFKII